MNPRVSVILTVYDRTQFLGPALESARRLGHDVTVVAIKEEAAPEVEQLAPRCHWISLGALSKLIEILKNDGISEVVMCGQVKHAKIFSSIRPDWRLVKVLASLPFQNTDGLIGGVIRVLNDEGIELRDSGSHDGEQFSGSARTGRY